MNDGFGPAPEDAPPARAAARWVALNTHPHREHIALAHLRRQHFTVYCPMERRRVRHARRTADVTRPLFPGYIFAAVTPDLTAWRPMLSTVGVRTLIRTGDRLAFLDDALIRALQAREIAGVIARPATPYTRGQAVRLAGGPFDGLVATLVDMDTRHRLVLLMTLLRQTVTLKLPACDVRPI